jgi:hypothetical protein
MEAVSGGPLKRAATQEAFGYMPVSFVQERNESKVFYRFAAPKDF